MENKFRISLLRQIFLIYLPILVEVTFHFFGEYLIGYLVKKYPDSSELIHLGETVFNWGLWILLTIGVIHVILEFVHFYADAVKAEKEAVQDLGNLHELVDEFRGEIKETYPIQHVGVVKKIVASNIWKFKHKVIGWNPNWSIEINTGNELNGALLDIHLERLKSKDVKTVQYIFLDGYTINKNNSAKFGIDNFFVFLKTLNARAIAKGNTRGILDYIKKYKILVMPKDKWFSVDSDLSREAMYYQSFIFIGGIRENGKSSLILFINKKGFLLDDKHEYYIEIFKDNQIYDSLTTSFDTIGDMAYELGLHYKDVGYDKTTKQFKIV